MIADDRAIAPNNDAIRNRVLQIKTRLYNSQNNMAIAYIRIVCVCGYYVHGMRKLPDAINLNKKKSKKHKMTSLIMKRVIKLEATRLKFLLDSPVICVQLLLL